MGTTAITADRLLEIGTAYRRARVLLSAIELDLFTAVADQPLDARTLARSIGIHERAARDFFDVLVALGLLERDSGDCYRSTPETSTYLDRRKSTFLGGMFTQFGRREYRMWESLANALRTGKPQTGIDADEHFTTLYRDRDRFRTFLDAMTAGSLLAAQTIAAKFPWTDYRTLVDVGTSQGCLPVEVARVHGHLSAEGFDLPELAEAFDLYVKDNDLGARVRFHAGNFLNEELPGADVLVFGRVLHNWDLPSKRMLLQKAFRALPPDGAVLVYDTLIDDERRSCATGLLSSLNMLVWTSCGFGYSGAECTKWMHEIGFRRTRVEYLAVGQSMIVGIK
jgi:O-methyltransferase domain/Dimerisation domain